MIIALIVWNVLLTAGLSYLVWRQLTFEKMVSRFSRDLVLMIEREAAQSIRLSKITMGITVATLIISILKTFKSDETPPAL